MKLPLSSTLAQAEQVSLDHRIWTSGAVIAKLVLVEPSALTWTSVCAFGAPWL